MASETGFNKVHSQCLIIWIPRIDFSSGEKIRAMRTATPTSVDIAAWNAMWGKFRLSVKGGKFYRFTLNVAMVAVDPGTSNSFPQAMSLSNKGKYIR